MINQTLKSAEITAEIVIFLRSFTASSYTELDSKFIFAVC